MQNNQQDCDSSPNCVVFLISQFLIMLILKQGTHFGLSQKCFLSSPVRKRCFCKSNYRFVYLILAKEVIQG